MRATEVFSWDNEAREGFSYQADPPGVAANKWRSHADDVLAGRAWQGDCDQLSETVLDLCCRNGLDKDSAYRLVVMAQNGTGGHMVGVIKDAVDQLWVVGDTFAPQPYPAENMHHRPVEYNRLSESVWRGGAPWALAN